MAVLGLNLIDGDVNITRSSLEAVAAAKAPTVVTVRPTGTSGTATKKSSTSTSRPKSSSGSGTGSSSSGSGGIKKSSDKAQVSALDQLLKSGFAKARDQKLANVQNVYRQQDDDIFKSFKERFGSLEKSARDNDMAEADSSFSNMVNRAREAGDLVAQAATQGLGETDNLRSQLMAIRNFDSNQGDINRSYFDTLRSVNTSQTDLIADTRNARINLASDMLGDYEQIWSNYYNQRADAYTQIGNIRANPYSDSYQANAGDYAKMAAEASTVWKNPGVNQSLLDWTGSGASPVQERALLNTNLGAAETAPRIKKPEGSTLRAW